MAGGAGDRLMRRKKMGGEFGLHDMAALSAELVGLHVFDGTVRHLASNDEICQGHDGEKNPGAPPRGFAVFGGTHLLGDLAPAKSDADGNQSQSGEKDDGDGEKRQQTYIWVADISSKVDGQRK